MGTVTYANTPATEDQEALRSRHGVRVVSSAEEGLGVNLLPAGVYGFTYSPALVSAPLWAQRRYRGYETHKLSDGEIVVIGFTDPETAAKIESAPGEQTILIQPEPDPTASVLVQVPYSRIRHHRQYAAPNEHGFTVVVGNR